jgi:hypothetical protein
MTYEESLAPATDNLLPANLEARILYHISPLTKNGQQQAKCVYLYEGIEYQGIIFSEGNEIWFKDIESGTVVKAEGIKPSKYPQYAGQYLGKISALNSQPNLLPRSAVNKEDITQGSEEPYFSYLVRLLRESADILEEAFSRVPKQNIVEEVAVETQVPVKLKYKGSGEWAAIIRFIILKTDRFNKLPFSVLTLNAHIDSSYKDWDEGDLENLICGARWRTMVSKAITILLECNFIERMPGTKKHYRLTKETLAAYF